MDPADGRTHERNSLLARARVFRSGVGEFCLGLYRCRLEASARGDGKGIEGVVGRSLGAGSPGEPDDDIFCAEQRGQIMTASAIQPKKQLALDTDWLSAAWALGAFFAFGFLFISTVCMTVRGNFKVSSMTWVTPFFAACLLFIAIGTPEK